MCFGYKFPLDMDLCHIKQSGPICSSILRVTHLAICIANLERCHFSSSWFVKHTALFSQTRQWYVTDLSLMPVTSSPFDLFSWTRFVCWPSLTLSHLRFLMMTTSQTPTSLPRRETHSGNSWRSSPSQSSSGEIFMSVILKSIFKCVYYRRLCR